MPEINRLMPDHLSLGQHVNGPLASATRFDQNHRFPNPEGLRRIMGFLLPPWQRGLVWTDAQCLGFMESVWLGLPLGTYAVNMRFGSRFDGWLIDGQQRINAISRYLRDEFPVLGYRWSEVTEVDRRVFENGTVFGFFRTESDDEAYLRQYYNRMNFGGTPHDARQRA